MALEAATTPQMVVVAASSFWWVSPLVTVFAAAIGGFIAINSIKANRAIARTRATLDLIERLESQPYYQELATAFKEIRGDQDGFRQILDPKSTPQKVQRAKILNFLNHYELVAVGCKKGVLDKDFYSMFMRSAVVRDWLAAETFVTDLRNPPGQHPRPKIYEHFEGLAHEWMDDIESERKLAEVTTASSARRQGQASS